MMSASTTTRPVSAQLLAVRGFTDEQVRRLLELRERYHPFREWCESDREYLRLSFLKWQVEQGQRQPG